MVPKLASYHYLLGLPKSLLNSLLLSIPDVTSKSNAHKSPLHVRIAGLNALLAIPDVTSRSNAHKSILHVRIAGLSTLLAIPAVTSKSNAHKSPFHVRIAGLSALLAIPFWTHMAAAGLWFPQVSFAVHKMHIPMKYMTSGKVSKCREFYSWLFCLKFKNLWSKQSVSATFFYIQNYALSVED